MKKLILISLFILINSCVTIRFPQSVKIDITIPETLDAEKIEILVDTLLSGKYEGTLEFNIGRKKHKSFDKTMK
tara:strand:+ start:2021 stop:2242 length:222 start_codon:yes stop_codon:yes gene_type:complete